MWPCRKKAAAAASSEGRLEAATSNNPFGKTDASATATADEPDIQAEATAMAVLAAERLANLLDFNAERSGPKAGLKVRAAIPPYWSNPLWTVTMIQTLRGMQCPCMWL